jgi:hypothetical protein
MSTPPGATIREWKATIYCDNAIQGVGHFTQSAHQQMRVLLFNPRSANYKPRIPNSILSIASSIEGIFDYVIVDGNLESDPWKKIAAYLEVGDIGFVGITAMPGPQLKQAIPFSKKIRELYPAIRIIWGGYFASNQPKAVLTSGYVDCIVNGPGCRRWRTTGLLNLSATWSTCRMATLFVPARMSCMNQMNFLPCHMKN